MIENPKKLDRILEKCLKGIEQKGWTVEDCLRRYPQEQDELEPILRAVLRLSDARSLRPSARFRAESSVRLSARMQASQRRAITRTKEVKSRKKPRGGQRLVVQWATPFVVAALVTSTALAAIGYAADRAGPGDLLYRIDLIMEELQLKLTKSSDAQARLHLKFASERLDEAARLMERGRTENIGETLDDYQLEINAAAPLINQGQEPNDALVLSASDTLNTHGEQLEDLLEIAPTESQEDIEVAIEEVEVVIVILSPPNEDEQPTPVGTTTQAATPPPLATPTPIPTGTHTPTPTPPDDEPSGKITPAPGEPTEDGGVEEPK
jgi:hypothetical protein